MEIESVYRTVVGSLDEGATQEHIRQIFELFNGVTLSGEEVAHLVCTLDTNGDGVVSILELRQALQAHVSQTQSIGAPIEQYPIQYESQTIRHSRESASSLDCSRLNLDTPARSHLELALSKFASELRHEQIVSLQNMIELIEDYSESKCTQARSEKDAMESDLLALQRKHAQLRQDHELLHDDCTRLEADFKTDRQTWRVFDDQSLEVSRLQRHVSELQKQLLQISESKDDLNIRYSDLNKRASEQERQLDQLRAARSLADDLDLDVLENMTDLPQPDVRFSPLDSPASLHDQSPSDLLVSRRRSTLDATQKRELLELRQNQESSFHEIKQLQASVDHRDQIISQLRDQLDEQTTLIRSIRTRPYSRDSSASPRVSIMKEIEDLVLSPVRHPESNPSVQLVTNIFPRPAKAATSPLYGHLSLKKTLSEPASSPRYGMSTHESSTSSPLRDMSSLFMASPLDATPPKQPQSSTPQAETSPKQQPRLRTVSRRLESSFGSRTESLDLISPAQEQLNDYWNLFAAASHHLSGSKLATKETVDQMDVRSLTKLENILRELVRAQSEKLIDELDERDRLRFDIGFKQTVVIPLIERSRSSPLQTRRSTNEPQSSITPTRSSTQLLEVNPSPQPRQEQSFFRFWGRR